MPDDVSGIPFRRLVNTFESFDLAANAGMKQAYERCIAVAEGREWCALLAGEAKGIGKTHLAIAAMHRFGLMRARLWKAPRFLQWIRETAFDAENRQDRIPVSELLHAYVTQDFLLVLDDLGVENKTSWADEQLYTVLDARCDNELPTIITTNVRKERIDERLRDRFRSGIVACSGKSMR